MLFYDFEVFKYDWLVVVLDMTAKKEYVIINSIDELQALYDAHMNDIWVGYNSRHYDQYILKAILCGFDPKEMNDWIIVKREEPWKFSNLLRSIPLNNYDVMPNPPVGLKTLEGFLGYNIKETEVPFDIDRKLTKEEIQQTIFYCRYDVQRTVNVFLHKKADFEAQFEIIKAFKLPLSCIGDTEARITAKVLECRKRQFDDDEFNFYFLPCLKLNKYKCVQEWFELKKQEALSLGVQHYDSFEKKAWYKAQSFKLIVAGIPHTFGFGGLHGAPEEPSHFTGLILHVDGNNYYPSMLIAWGLVTRAAGNNNYQKVYKTRKALKYKQKHSATKEEAKKYKKQQLPYKKMLNALSGAMKDATNPAYDPRNNNIMCINGQLMLLDLIEHLEVVPGFELIQSNTDGLIIRIPDTDEAFDMVDDICYEWEQRCSTSSCEILLELDTIREIYQKDVNNYLWVDADGGVERIGLYLKELSPIDNDLPILNKALVEYMVNKIPVEQTIRQCDDLIQFQKIVKLSDKYKWVEHECGGRIQRQSGVRVIKTYYEYTQTQKYNYKSYRVFASSDPNDGKILKRGGSRGKPEKFGNTPDHCFISNDDITGAKCPPKLDKQWYIDKAKKRLKDFGVMCNE